MRRRSIVAALNQTAEQTTHEEAKDIHVPGVAKEQAALRKARGVSRSTYKRLLKKVGEIHGPGEI